MIRVKFGPLGWNVTYNFGDSDLDTAFKLLGRFVDDLHADASTPSLTALPIESLVYVTGNITYGGWVTDEWDRRCLLAVLDHFYSASIFGDTVSMFCRCPLLYCGRMWPESSVQMTFRPKKENSEHFCREMSSNHHWFVISPVQTATV